MGTSSLGLESSPLVGSISIIAKPTKVQILLSPRNVVIVRHNGKRCKHAAHRGLGRLCPCTRPKCGRGTTMHHTPKHWPRLSLPGLRAPAISDPNQPAWPNLVVVASFRFRSPAPSKAHKAIPIAMQWTHVEFVMQSTQSDAKHVEPTIQST